MDEVMFIIYVKDQQKSKEFYEKLLQISPSLDVPGMTEFKLSDNVKFGIMLENGIVKIFSKDTPHPKNGNGIPRCELYLRVIKPSDFIERGKSLGGKIISKLQDRDWGDKVGYIPDLDGHVIAFAEK